MSEYSSQSPTIKSAYDRIYYKKNKDSIMAKNKLWKKNNMLGHAKDTIIILKNAIEYLEEDTSGK